MALNLYNAAEGTDTTAITAASQTAGTGSDTLDTLTGTGLTFSATHPAHGTTGFLFTTASPVVAAYLAWTTSLGTLSTNQTLYVRLYYYATAVPTSSVRLVQILNGTTALCGINHASGTGNLGLRVTGDVGTGTVEALPAIPNNTLVRIEATFTGIGTTTTGNATANWYTGDSLTVGSSTNPASITNLSFGSLAPNALRAGITTANASVTSTYYIDDLAVSDTAMPGIPGTVTSSGLIFPRRMPLGV